MSNAELIQKWETAKATLNLYKKIEGDLRKEILKQFSDPAKTEGTETYSTDLGELKITKAQSYSLANKDKETQILAQSMSLENQIRLFSWSPKLDKKEFETLKQLAGMETARGEVQGENSLLLRAIETVLTIKQGSPQIKMVKNDPPG